MKTNTRETARWLLIAPGRSLRWLIIASLLQCAGCATTAPFPEDWAPALANDSSPCTVPTGDFSNHGSSNDDTVSAPTLSAILFNEEMEGFSIDRVRISEPVRKTLQANLLVGEVQLVEERVLEPAKKNCGGAGWLMQTPTEYLDGYTASASLMWTAGALMPIAMWANFRFQVAADGSLLVNAQQREVVDFFYFFPVPMTTDDVWFRYQRLDELETSLAVSNEADSL